MIYEMVITKMMMMMMMMSRTKHYRREITNDSAAVRKAEVETTPYLDHLRRRLVG